MALPICRLPICSGIKAKMTNKQLASRTSHLSSSDVWHITLRIACCLSSAVLLYGCSTPPPITPIPSDEPLTVVTVSSVAPAASVNPPVVAVEAMAPLSEENNVFFALRFATIDDTGKEKLQRHADRLKSNRKQTVMLVGHSDHQGSRNYNLAITEERLVAVEKLLRRYGVSVRQIRRIRTSSVKNSSSCTTNQCRQEMRRVELVYAPLR